MDGRDEIAYELDMMSRSEALLNLHDAHQPSPDTARRFHEMAYKHRNK